MAARYGSDLIVDLMKILGIEYVALNPGSSFRGIHDSLVNYESGRQPNPEMILCCHEEIAVAVAHGYAKATGKIMPAIVHNVVGLQHASMAIYNAWCDHTPVMVMGGTGPMNSSKRRPWIDWIHTAQVQGNLVRDFVKWDDQPVGVEAFPSSIMRGYRIAMSDPGGPVYLCFDVTDQEAAIEKEIPLPDPSRFRPPAPLQADYDAIKEAAQLLSTAQNPVILADYVGRNNDAVMSLVALADLLSIPVVDFGARLNFPNTHSLNLTGRNRELIANADVIMGLDMTDLYGALVRAGSRDPRDRPGDQARLQSDQRHAQRYLGARAGPATFKNWRRWICRSLRTPEFFSRRWLKRSKSRENFPRASSKTGARRWRRSTRKFMRAGKRISKSVGTSGPSRRRDSPTKFGKRSRKKTGCWSPALFAVGRAVSGPGINPDCFSAATAVVD